MSEEIKLTNQEELEDDVVMLEDEEGNEIAFHYITTIEHEGKEYVYLQASEETEDDEVIVEIYELEESEEDGEQFDSLLPVEDELYEILYNKLLESIQAEGEDGACNCGCDEHKDHECNCKK